MIDLTKPMSVQSHLTWNDCITWDLLISRLHMLLDAENGGVPYANMKELTRQLTMLLERLFSFCKGLIIDDACFKSNNKMLNSLTARLALAKVMSISRGQPLKIAGFGLVAWSYLHQDGRAAMDRWNKITLSNYPNVRSWVIHA